MSDVHCNADAFDRAVAELEPEVDEILLLGDAVYEYRFSNEVVGGARRLGMRYMLGNHEMGILGPHGERARSAAHVDQAEVDFLRAGAHPHRHDASGASACAWCTAARGRPTATTCTRGARC